MATAISQSIASDGQTTTSAAISFSQGILLAPGLVTLPGLSFIGDADTGFYSPAPNQVGFATGGVLGVLFTPIGLTVPLALTVGDNASFALAVTIAGTLTANGNVVIGNSVADTLTVASTGTWTGPQTFSGAITLPTNTVTNAQLANMPTARIKGRVTAATGPVEDLTGTQVTTLLDVVVGATGSPGTKGLAPAPSVAQKRLVLTGGGTYERGPGRLAGCFLTTTNSVGSPVVVGGSWNVASASNLASLGGSTVGTTISFTDALPDNNYAVQVSKIVAVMGAATADSGYRNKTTTTVDIEWDNTGAVATEVSVSIF